MRFFRRSYLIFPFIYSLTLASCTATSNHLVLSALAKSDFKSAVSAAKNDRRSARLLAREILIRGAKQPELEKTLVNLIKGGSRKIIPVIEVLKKSPNPVIRAVSLMKLHSFGKKKTLDDLEPFLDSQIGLARAATVAALRLLRKVHS